jgi:hypothetical protein
MQTVCRNTARRASGTSWARRADASSIASGARRTGWSSWTGRASFSLRSGWPGRTLVALGSGLSLTTSTQRDRRRHKHKGKEFLHCLSSKICGTRELAHPDHRTCDNVLSRHDRHFSIAQSFDQFRIGMQMRVNQFWRRRREPLVEREVSVVVAFEYLEKAAIDFAQRTVDIDRRIGSVCNAVA